MGSQQSTPSGDASVPSLQQIVMQPTAPNARDRFYYREPQNGAQLVPTNAKPVVSIMVSANIADPDWDDNVLRFEIGTGLNVSERPPLTYYPQPTWSPNGQEFDSYYGDIATSNVLPDVPFDEDDGAFLAPDELQTGTIPSFRVAVLQRLADPTKRWDAQLNPYISIDTQPIDLSVFNGEDRINPFHLG